MKFIENKCNQNVLKKIVFVFSLKFYALLLQRCNGEAVKNFIFLNPGAQGFVAIKDESGISLTSKNS